MNPEIFSIGPFAVHWYGLLIVGGAVLAAWIASLQAKRRGDDPDHIWNMLIWVLIIGIIGARLYHVFSIPAGCTPETPCGWYLYRQDPIAAINFWDGGFRGLGIYGGIVGGLIGMLLYVFNFNRGHGKRLERARSLLSQLREAVGDDLVQSLLDGDISTLPGLDAQRQRVARLQQRLRQLDGWKAASLMSVADVFAQGSRPILDGDRRRRLAEATDLLKASRALVGHELADAILAGDTSTAEGRQAQKQRITELRQQLRSVPGQEALQLDQLAPVFAERKLVLARWLDYVAPGLLLAQAVGRMGNRINQELYGPPTDLPWAFHINPEYPCQVPEGAPGLCGRPELLTEEVRQWYATNGFHPTFFYEALWNLVGFFLILFASRRYQSKLRDGDLILFYLVWYPLGRILVEMFRPDAWVTGVPGLATAQLIGLGLIVVSLVIYFLRHRNWSPPTAVAPTEPAVAASEEASS